RSPSTVGLPSGATCVDWAQRQARGNGPLIWAAPTAARPTATNANATLRSFNIAFIHSLGADGRSASVGSILASGQPACLGTRQSIGRSRADPRNAESGYTAETGDATDAFAGAADPLLPQVRSGRPRG